MDHILIISMVMLTGNNNFESIMDLAYVLYEIQGSIILQCYICCNCIRLPSPLLASSGRVLSKTRPAHPETPIAVT